MNGHFYSGGRVLRTIFAFVLLVTTVSSSQSTSSPSPVDEQIIGAAISKNAAMEFLENLTDRIGGRLTGSPESAATASLIVETLRSAGFADAHSEEYPLQTAWRRGEAKARVISPTARPIYVGSYGWTPGTSGPTPAPLVEATMLPAGTLDLSPTVMKDAAVLVNIVTGTKTYATNYIVQRARAFQQCAKAGAVAMLIPSDKPHRMLYTSAFGMYPRAPLPILSVAREDTEFLRRLMKKGPVKLELDIRNDFIQHPSLERNVVAEIPGSGNEIVIVGAHFDSWDVAQGANDNGSGVAAVLQAARILKSLGVKPRATIRFVFFSGEEQGCLGSRAYVEAHKADLDRIRMFVVMDGGAQAPAGLSVKGRSDLVAPLTSTAEVLRPFAANRVIPEGEVGSDDETFISLGIPALELMTEPGDYDTNHHAITDTLDKIDPRSLAADTASVALIAWHLADRDAPPGRRLRSAELFNFLNKAGLLEGIRVTHGSDWSPE
jgi:carboxypeptidase Q